MSVLLAMPFHDSFTIDFVMNITMNLAQRSPFNKPVFKLTSPHVDRLRMMFWR